MLAILKRETKSYFTGMIGYVVVAVFLAVLGLYFTNQNLMFASPDFGGVLYTCTILLLFLLPALSMRSFAEERRAKTDQLLLTSPVSIPGIVLGKRGRLLAEHSLAGAGCIHQHPVKPAGQRSGNFGRVLVGNNSVGNTHALQILAQDFRPGAHVLIGQQHALSLQRGGQLTGFAAGRGAQIRHPHAGLHLQQRCRGGGAWFLRIKHPRMMIGMTAGTELRRHRKGCRAERRGHKGKIHLLRQRLRRTAQRVDGDAPRRFRRGKGIQFLKTRSQQGALAGFKFCGQLHFFLHHVYSPSRAGKLSVQPASRRERRICMARNQNTETTQKTTNNSQQKNTNNTQKTTNSSKNCR